MIDLPGPKKIIAIHFLMKPVGRLLRGIESHERIYKKINQLEQKGLIITYRASADGCKQNTFCNLLKIL
jgi:hypothetical protein